MSPNNLWGISHCCCFLRVCASWCLQVPVGGGVLAPRPRCCFWGEKGEERAVPTKESKLVESFKGCLLNMFHANIWVISLSSPPQEVGFFLFALLCRKEIEAPAIAMTHSRPLGERVVEPGLKLGLFGSKGHVPNRLALLPEGSGRGW